MVTPIGSGFEIVRTRAHLSHLDGTQNPFVSRFAATLSQSYRVSQLNWLSLPFAEIVVIHWPENVFRVGSWREKLKSNIKLFMLAIARSFGVRTVWLVHNLEPHDSNSSTTRLITRFAKGVDQVIHLSEASARLFSGRYTLKRASRTIVLRHPSYRGLMHSVESRRVPGGPNRLLYFGQVRPYKNLEALLDCFSRTRYADGELRIIGFAPDNSYAQKLRQLAQADSRISISFSEHMLPAVEIEREIDEAAGVVLPYRSVLNSGSALLALSRFRPILVPRLGSLPELQKDVTSEWVRMYSGDLSPEVLHAFLEHTNRPPMGDPPNMDLYRWECFESKLLEFLKPEAR